MKRGEKFLKIIWSIVCAFFLDAHAIMQSIFGLEFALFPVRECFALVLSLTL